MKEKLIEILGLKPASGQTEVSDDQVVSAVAAIQSQLHGHFGAVEYEKAINDLIIESCGAFTREVAKEVLANRAREAVKTPGLTGLKS